MKRITLWLCGALCTLTAGTLSAQEALGELRVSLVPAASLSVDYQAPEQGESFTKAVPAGKEILLKAAKPGYETAYRTVRVSEGAVKAVDITLKRKEIPVLFRANVPATVLLDGAILGVTPYHHFFAQPKIYQIEVEAEGYQKQKYVLNLANGKPQVKTFDLTSNSGTLVVTSDPEGAQVFLNGIERGHTPCTIEKLREDTYALALKKADYQSETRTLKVMAGDVAEVDVALEPLPATLKITSTPEGAQVFINGIFRGKTPVTIDNLDAGQHLVTVKKEGYGENHRTLRLVAGGTKEETFALNVVLGSLTVQTEPAVVAVYNGYTKLFETEPKKAGDYRSARKTQSLAPGKYTLTFKANGYATATRDVTISPNATATLAVKLDFKPNFKIQTTSGLLKGVWVSNEPNGDIRIEVQPGMIKRIPRAEIISTGALVE